MNDPAAQPLNNIPDSFGVNLYDADPEFERLLRIYLNPAVFSHVEPQFRHLGALAGAELETLALTADVNPPVLHSRARSGAAADRIEKHPSYIELEKFAFGEFGLAAMSHRGGVFGWNDKLPPVVKYGLTMLFVQAEFGLCCPVSMTDSLTRVITKFGSETLNRRYLAALTSQDMDQLYQGAMFITEQAAGSDVGAIETVAKFEHGDWRIYGEKWFCSNPDAELAMVLARPEGAEDGTRGLSLFLLPRHLPNGERNGFRIERLKVKLGTRSMASGEIRLDGAIAYLIGEPGAGFRQMADMINMSRLSNGVRSAGLMRRGVNEALHISRNREAFGKKLVDLPLMRRQLVKMLTVAEQGRSMVLHTARVLERADAGDQDARRQMRILTPLIKFRTCRDARKIAGDALEVRGGGGYIEEWSDARVLRDAHLGSVWEGTSNIVALDVVRAIRRERALPALRDLLRGLLDEPALPGASRTILLRVLDDVCGLAEKIADDRAREADTRRIASALYNITSAIFMAWEAARIDGRWNRLGLAHLVLRHRLLPSDPLGEETENLEALQALIDDDAMSDSLALSLLPV
jgi:alkylation response protein AidB-like acyl-CoA dehydrogenase